MSHQKTILHNSKYLDNTIITFDVYKRAKFYKHFRLTHSTFSMFDVKEHVGNLCLIKLNKKLT